MDGSVTGVRGGGWGVGEGSYKGKTDYKRQITVFELVLCLSKVSTHNTCLILQWLDGVGEGTRKRGICPLRRLVPTYEFYNGGQIYFG